MITINGQVGAGRGVGKTIGYPTINLLYDGGARGIFAGKVFINDVFVLAAIHLGPRPTFEDDSVICEAFLLDFDGHVEIGTFVQVEAYKKIRNIKKFKNTKDLADQISGDVEFVKNWYNSDDKLKKYV